MRYLFLVLFLAGCGDIASDSIVQIKFGEGGTCSGFFMESDIVVTSSHCYEDGEEGTTVTYLDSDSDPREIEGTLIYSEDSREGLAVVYVDLDGPAVEICEGHIGNKIKIMGWFGDERQSVDGRILWKWGEKYWSNADAVGGYSGAAVVNNGCVIAMHHGRTITNTTYDKKPVIKELERERSPQPQEQTSLPQ